MRRSLALFAFSTLLASLPAVAQQVQSLDSPAAVSMEANEDGKNIYDMAVEQFRYLEVEQSSCFEKVNVTGENKTQFDLEAGENFYMLVRNTESRFRYVFCDEDGAEVSVLLEYIK